MVALVAAAALTSPHTGFAFGRAGGNIRPFRVSISVDAVVHATGAAPQHAAKVTKLELATLNRVAYETDFVHLPASTACRGVLPDVATSLIRVGGRTVRVHGSCIARFDRLWAVLVRSVR